MQNFFDRYAEIKIADFLQKPQEANGEFALETFSTNDQHLKLSYDHHGLNVRVIQAGWAEVRIKLNPTIIQIPLDDHKLVFDFKSENVAEIIVKFYSNSIGEDGILCDRATQKMHTLNSGCNESLKIKLPKKFSWIAINPCYAGTFHIKNMLIRYEEKKEEKKQSIANQNLNKIFFKYQIANDFDLVADNYLVKEFLQDIQDNETKIDNCKELLKTIDTIHQIHLFNKYNMEIKIYRDIIKNIVDKIRQNI